MMLLEDIYEYVSENRTIIVLYNGVEVCRYDGKNAIDEKYNEYAIMEIWAQDDALVIEIG